MPSQSSFWKTIGRFVRPEIEELIVYVLIIICFGITAFIQYNTQSGISSTQDISSALSLIQDRFQFLTDGDDKIAKFFTFALWFGIGTLVYVMAWFLITFSSGAFNEVRVSSYVHPSSFDKSKYWGAVVGRVVLQAAAAISLLMYAAFWCAGIAPVWLASIKAIFIDGLSAESLGSGMLALVGIGLSLHIAAILLRLVLLRSRYTYQK